MYSGNFLDLFLFPVADYRFSKNLKFVFLFLSEIVRQWMIGSFCILYRTVMKIPKIIDYNKLGEAFLNIKVKTATLDT